MTRVRSWMVLAIMLVLGAAFAAAQARAAEGPRRGFRGLSRGSLLGLLRLEQVQKELKLSEEQTAKVREVVEKLGAEMGKEYAALREKVEDREQRRAKRTELSDQFDRKAREQLRGVLEREQMMRLYQIRMQVRPVVDSLANKFVASRLKITDEQQKKLAEIAKETQAEQSKLFSGMREATDEQRAAAFQKLSKLRSEADEKALAVLTAEQKEAFQKMKGEKFELQMPRGPR